MIVVDANVLLYAYDTSSPSHATCRDWFNDALNGHEQIGLPWQTLLAFVRISTNPRAFRMPLSAARACDIVSAWLDRPQVIVPAAGDNFWPLCRQQIEAAKVSGPTITDAALAAIALEHGATLCTTDRDFHRFDGLKLLDPTR